ncbi:MAG TPA: hypothetical protein VJA16_01335 [Thermoanaerobaculia bacterium]
MNAKASFAAALTFCLVTLPLAAVIIPPGNEGWATLSSNTQINLGQISAVSQALGAAVAGNGIAGLSGVALNTSQLGNADAIISRGSLSGGTGSASIVALNLASTSPVKLTDGRSFSLQICLPTGTAQPQGSVTFQPRGSNAGNMTASLPVVPLLVFTNTNNPQDMVRVDCSVVQCPSIDLTTQNAPYVLATASQASAAGIGTLPSGNVSVANCGGQVQVSLVGQANVYVGATFLANGTLSPVNVQVTNAIVTHLMLPFTFNP